MFIWVSNASRSKQNKANLQTKVISISKNKKLLHRNSLSTAPLNEGYLSFSWRLLKFQFTCRRKLAMHLTKFLWKFNWAWKQESHPKSLEVRPTEMSSPHNSTKLICFKTSIIKRLVMNQPLEPFVFFMASFIGFITSQSQLPLLSHSQFYFASPITSNANFIDGFNNGFQNSQ